MTRTRSARLAVLGLCLIGFSVTLLVWWPGSLSADSWGQWDQARTGEYEGWHPPIMAFVWRVLAAAFGGRSEPMLLFHVAALWTGLLLIGWTLASSAPGAALFVPLVGLLPPVFGMAGVIWKDVGLASMAVFAIGLSIDQRLVPKPVRLTMLLAALYYCATVRHNGASAVPPIAYLAITSQLMKVTTFRTRLAAAAASIAAPLAFMLIEGQFEARVLQVRKGPLYQQILLHDLAALHASSAAVEIPPEFLVPGRPTAALLEEALQDNRSSDPLVYGARAPLRFLPADSRALAQLPACWLAGVTANPRAYLAHRWTLFASLLDWGFSPCRAYHLYFEDQPSAFRKKLRERAAAVLQWSAGKTPLHRGWPWLLLSVAGVLILIPWRRNSRRKAAACSFLCGILLTLPYFFTTPSCDFRYLLLLIPSAALGLILLVAGIWPAADEIPGPAASSRGRRCAGWAATALACSAFGVYVHARLPELEAAQWAYLESSRYHVLRVRQQYGAPERNRLTGRDELRLAIPYEDALSTHAQSHITLKMKGRGERLRGACVYPSNVAGNAVRCRVKSGEQVLFESELLTDDHRVAPFDVPAPRSPVLLLEFESKTADITAAHGTWVDLRVE